MGAKALTPQQLAFCHNIAEGMNPSAAYSRAYPRQSLGRDALSVEAARLRKNPKVVAYINDLLAEARREVLLTRDKKRMILGGIALNKNLPPQARIAAIQVDNRMTGDEKPVRIEGEITLHQVLQLLEPSTGLPDPSTVEQLKEAVPVEPAKTVEDAPVTEMERAG